MLDEVYDDAKLNELAQLARETGIWTVPTLATIRGTAASPDEIAAFSERKATEFVDYTVMSFWRMSAAFRAAWTPDTYRGARLQLEQDLRQVKAFHDAGARILAGTDAPNPWAFVGFGMVDELELYVEAGLSPFAALQTATTAPAEFMNEAGRSGIVAEGARADLVLLDGNPLENVAAYRDIAGVMAAGPVVRPGVPGFAAGRHQGSQRPQGGGVPRCARLANSRGRIRADQRRVRAGAGRAQPGCGTHRDRCDGERLNRLPGPVSGAGGFGAQFPRGTRG